jgi:hypothetical protein
MPPERINQIMRADLIYCQGDREEIAANNSIYREVIGETFLPLVYGHSRHWLDHTIFTYGRWEVRSPMRRASLRAVERSSH